MLYRTNLQHRFKTSLSFPLSFFLPPPPPSSLFTSHVGSQFVFYHMKIIQNIDTRKLQKHGLVINNYYLFCRNFFVIHENSVIFERNLNVNNFLYMNFGKISFKKNLKN